MLQQRIANAVRRAATLFALGALACAILAAAVQGGEAFGARVSGGLIPELGIALRALLALPLFWLATRRARARRTRDASLILGSTLLGLCLLSAVSRGVQAPAWFALPLLVLAVAIMLGARFAFVFAFTGAGAHLLCALGAPGAGVAAPGEALRHTLVVAAALLGAGLLGAFLDAVLDSLAEVEHDHRRRVAGTVKALRRREAMLQHAMRLNTVGAVASMVVHQLRNCFQLVLGDAALGHDATEEEVDRRLRRIRESIGDAAQITGKLLVLAHPLVERNQRVDLGDRVRAITNDLRRFLPATITLEVQIDPGSMPVRLDPAELEHALLNLVINSRQAIAGTGRIWIEVRHDGAGEVSLRVTDSGCGISAATLPHVFDPFFTTKPKGEGTGLGLAAVREFASGCGARVAVESVVGLGTTFRIVFPLGHDVPAVGTLASREPPASLATA